MSKPRFANSWYQTPRVSELRQEFQNVYDDVTTAEDDIDSLESGKVDNVGSVPGIIAGAADSTDADGNPTPNTTDFPAANYDEGTVFLATSYAAGVDGGSMQFRLESGAWVWRWGQYSASSTFSGTGSGNYRRDADGTQEAQARKTTTYVSAPTLEKSWTFPAVFSEIPFVSATDATSSVTTRHIHGRYRGLSLTGLVFEVIHDNDGFVSGNTVDVDGIVTGRWK